MLKAHKLRAKVTTLLLQCQACSGKRDDCFVFKPRSEPIQTFPLQETGILLGRMAPQRGSKEKELRGESTCWMFPSYYREISPDKSIALKVTMLLID